MSRTNVALLLVALGALGSAGCGKEAPPAPAGWQGAVDTTETGVRVVRNTGGGLWAPGQTPELAVTYRIAMPDPDPNARFDNVRAFDVDREGRLHLSDRSASTVTSLGPDGDSLATLGRPRAGRTRQPGELEYPIGVAASPTDDVVWVFDSQGLYVGFAPDGTFLREFERPVPGLAYPWEGYFEADGRLVERWHGILGRSPLLAVTLADSAAAVTEAFPDPLADVGAGQDPGIVVAELADGESRIVRLPFLPSAHWAPDREGGLWVGHSGEYRLVHLTLEGDTTLIVERLEEPYLVLRELLADSLARVPGAEELDEDDRARIPRSLPYFDALLPTPGGGVWVLRFNGVTTFFDAFARDGRYLGRVDFGERMVGGVRPLLTRTGLYMMVAEGDGGMAVGRWVPEQ